MLKLSRRVFGLTGAAALAALAQPAARAQPRPENPKVTLAVATHGALYDLPLTLAQQLNYFKAEGLETDLQSMNGSARVQQALLSGSVDVVSGSYEQVLQLQAQGQKVQAFVLLLRSPMVSLGVSVKALPRYNAVAHLYGRRIGVSAPGSVTHMLAHRLLMRSGMPASAVSFVGVGTGAGAVAALRTGQVDALSNTEPVMTLLEQKGELRMVADARTQAGCADLFGGPMPAGCLYATTQWLQKYPATAQALASSVVHALKWLQTAGPSDLIKTVPEAYMLGDRALYLASFNNVRDAIALDGMVPEAGPKIALAALSDFDPSFKAERVELAKTFTNEFARRAKEKFKT